MEYERVRPVDSRSPSKPTGYTPAQQPINDAVTSAFDKADASHGISPELLSQLTSQITANVLQQLKGNDLKAKISSDPGLNASNSKPASLSSPPPSTTSPPPAQEGGSATTSPIRVTDDLSPPSSFSQSHFTHPAHGHSSPERTQPSPDSHSSRTNGTPPKGTSGNNDVRPKGPVRLSTGHDATLVEKAWGQLYDEDGAPTARLGQFLRGIANHLIEDYEPKHSLVVTPAKMQQFYRETAISSELYPWDIVFDDRTSSISRLFRELGIMHHLLQEEGRYDERPDIPGLTAQGFQKWVTLLLQANPEQEFERLQKVVLDMPISNADNPKDRYPKEISRRLFPANREVAVKERIEKAMMTHCNITIPMRGNGESDTSRNPMKTESSNLSNGPPPATTNGIERERQPYSGTPSTDTSVTDDEEDMPTPQPIERERKPYSVQPGAGKIYSDGSKPSTSSIPSTSPIDPPKESHVLRARGYSTASASRYEPPNPSLPPNTNSGPKSRPIPIVSNGNRNGGAPPSAFDPYTAPAPGDIHGHLHPRTGSMHRTQSLRNRSPSTTDPFRHSEPEFASSTRPTTTFPEHRNRDYERGTYRDDSQRMSMYEIGSSIPGRERGRYRHESTGASGGISPAPGGSIPSHSYPHPQVNGREYYPGDDERYRNAAGGPARPPPPLGATPGSAGYDYGQSPPTGGYYR